MILPSVVRAFVFNPHGEILLTKHKKDGLWVLPGGHTENGEFPNNAILRELKEEFSLEARFFAIDQEEILSHKGKKLTHLALPITTYELHYSDSEGKNRSRIESIFLMETDFIDQDNKNLKIQTQEIIEYKWFDADDILMMKPNIETWDFIIEMLEKIIGEDDE